VLVLVRLWMRRLRVERSDVVEERYVDRSEESEARPQRRRRLVCGGTPADAVAAYRALLADLAERNGVRREAWETPHEHAERLRQARLGGLALDPPSPASGLPGLGGGELPPAENRRAVSRWRLLRRRLQALPESEEELSNTL